MGECRAVGLVFSFFSNKRGHCLEKGEDQQLVLVYILLKMNQKLKNVNIYIYIYIYIYIFFLKIF